MADSASLLQDAEDCLALASKSLDQIEATLTRLEGLVSLIDSDIESETVERLSVFESALSTTMHEVSNLVASLHDPLEAISTGLQVAEEDAHAKSQEALEKFDGTLNQIGDSAQQFGHHALAHVADIEHAFSTGEDHLLHRADETKQLFVREATSTVQAVNRDIENFNAGLRATVQQLKHFTSSIEGSVSPVLDVFKRIEAIIAPIQEILPTLEKLA